MTDYAQVAYKAYGEHAEWKNFQGDPMPTWEELPDPIRSHWYYAAAAILAEGEYARAAKVDPAPILRVERPYIPTIDIFGTVHTLRHPLQNSGEQKKKIGEIGARYTKLMGVAAEEIDEQMQRTMRSDMGILISIFVPTLRPDDLELLDQGDRFRVIGACFAAYDDVMERQKERNAISDDLSAEERQRMQEAIARVDTAPSDA